MADESGGSAGEDLTLEPLIVVGPGRSRALWVVLAAIAVVTGAVVATTGGTDASPRLPLALGAAAGETDRAMPTSAMMAFPITYVAGNGLPAMGGDSAAYRIDGQVDAARVRTLAKALGLTGAPVHTDRVWQVTDGNASLQVSEDGGGSWWYSPNGGVVSSDGGSSSVGGSSSAGSTGSGCAPGPDGACAPPVPQPTTVNPSSTEPAATDAKPAECPANADCAVPTCPPDAICSYPTCTPDAYCTTPIKPPPPVDLPTKAEARKIALDLLATTGLDTADAKVTVDGPYDAWFVTVEPMIDGMVASGWMSSVAVGDKGAITSASGTMGRVVKLGSYPLLDTKAAIDRLNAQGGYGGGPVPMGVAGVAPNTAVAPAQPPVAVDQAPADASGCTVQPDGSEICQSTGTGLTPPACSTRLGAPSIATSTTVAPEPGCPDPVPYEPPTPRTIVLTGAEQILMVQYAIDGSNDAYLVPGYRFSSAESYTPEVVAVTDDSLAPTTTIPTAPKPTGATEPGQTQPGQTQPGVAPPSAGAGTPSQEPSTAKP